MGILEQVYKIIARKGDIIETDTFIPYRTTMYVRAALEDRGIKVPDLKELERVLFEEGHLPSSAYEIPGWYRQKYRFE